ncbi:MAG: ABC transporter ATP-binding protein [Planctomycetota bacterium]
MSSSENGSANDAVEPVIKIQNLSRHFGSTIAVEQLSFHVKPGEVFGFIGPNGAGKTTTMKILATLDTPTIGEAWVDGFSVVNDPDRVRRRLGYMPDGFGTYPNVSCEEYLDFFARSYGLKGSNRKDALDNVMEFTQLDRLAEKPVDGLSKGMKQRLCLGRALIHDPSVLILDEPAAGLDPRARIELREMIVRLAKDGKAFLISSHILTELAEMCDRVAIIEKGRLLAEGSVEEILNRGTQINADSDNQSIPANSCHIIEISVLSDREQACHFLHQHDLVTSIDQDVKTGSNLIAFEFEGEEELQAELLSEMVHAGILVSRFQIKEKSLEDAFLQVTKGLVQ